MSAASRLAKLEGQIGIDDHDGDGGGCERCRHIDNPFGQGRDDEEVLREVQAMNEAEARIEKCYAQKQACIGCGRSYVLAVNVVRVPWPPREDASDYPPAAMS